MRIAIADDSLIARRGVVDLVGLCGFTVCSEAGDGPQLLVKAEADPPDVALLDVRMPPTFTDEGLQTAAALRRLSPQTGILLLSTYADATYAEALLGIGSSGVGYLLKDRIDSIGKLSDAIQRVADRECVIDSDIVSQLFSRQAARSKLGDLTSQEHTVLEHIAEGRSNGGIAKMLHLTLSTVETHCGAIFRKLGLKKEDGLNQRVAAVLVWLQAAARSAN